MRDRSALMSEAARLTRDGRLAEAMALLRGASMQGSDAAAGPRKGATVLYLVPSILESDPLMKKLGKHKNGKSCLYINKLADVDLDVLRELAKRSWDYMVEKYG